MKESSIAMSRRQHLTNDTESHRVRMRISTAEVASAKKQNVLFKKKTPPPPPHTHTHTHIRLHKHYLQLLLEPLSYLRETKNQGDRKFFLRGAGGANKVYYGRCANGELENHERGRTVMSDRVLWDAGRETRKQEKKGCDIRLCPFL